MGLRGEAAIVGCTELPATKRPTGPLEFNLEQWARLAASTLADAGIDASEVGLAHALATVTSASPKPPKSAGEKVTDEGDGGSKIAAYLVAQKLV